MGAAADQHMFGSCPAWVEPNLIRRCAKLNQGLIINDSSGRIIAASPEACRILHQNWEDLADHNPANEHSHAITAEGNILPSKQHPTEVALTEGRPITGFLMAVVPNQATALTWMRVDALPQFGTDGQTIGVATIFVDVTETDVGRASEGSLQESFWLVTERSQDMITRHSPTSEYLYASPRSVTLLGYEPHELVGRMAYELIHPNDVPTVSGSHEQQFEQRTIVPYRLRRKDGSYVEVETLSEGILDHNGHLIEIQCSTRDVTERNRLRAEKLDSERRLRTLVELLTDGVLMVDNNDVIVTANRAAAELLGHTELIGRPLNDVLPELRDNAGQRFKRNGRWLDVKASVTDDAERSAERVLQIVDVSSDVLSREELQRRAAYDQLTGLFNRESTMDYLSNGLAAGPVGVLFIDLNDFKGINDNQGHAAGDGCLRQVADRFKASLRSGDVIGRLGGDEFLVVLRDPPSDLELTGIAEKLCRAVSAPLTEGPRTVRLSASIGIARGTRRCEPAHLVRAADRAMYEAKRAGHDVAVSPTLVQPVT